MDWIQIVLLIILGELAAVLLIVRKIYYEPKIIVMLPQDMAEDEFVDKILKAYEDYTEEDDDEI